LFGGAKVEIKGKIFLANVCFATVFLITKDVQPRMDFYPFLFYWFLSGSIFYLLSMAFSSGLKTFRIPRRWIPLGKPSGSRGAGSPSPS